MTYTNPNKWTQLLMVEPTYFTVEYAINPHMLDAAGNLNQVDRELAHDQWLALKDTFENIGLKIHVLNGVEGLPDKVFSANQAMPFVDPKTGERSAVMSKMKSHYRQPEIQYFKTWLSNNGYKVYELESAGPFESNGDVIPHPGKNFFWGGCGPRTDGQVYDELKHRFGLNLEVLNLIHPDYYHLDTALVIFNDQTCAIVKEAFDIPSLTKLRDYYKDVIEIDLSEAKKAFAGNAFCPDGKNVVLHKGASNFEAAMRERGFTVHIVDTGEFLKSGGSVFCMKLALP